MRAQHLVLIGALIATALVAYAPRERANEQPQPSQQSQRRPEPQPSQQSPRRPEPQASQQSQRRLEPQPSQQSQRHPEPWPPVATFSILAYDSATGEVGGAVQSRVFSVGNGVLWAEAGAGAVATQAIVDVSYGPQGIALLKQGTKPADVIRRVLENDPDPRPEAWSKEGRQFAVIDAQGNVAAHTGARASAWAGHRTGRHVTVQGNILAGEPVVDSMIAAFQASAGQHLSFRLLAALEAGQAAGGDRRGMQSAAMLIVGKNGGVWLNNDVVLRLQVDDSTEPIAELRRLVEKAATQRRPARR